MGDIQLTFKEFKKDLMGKMGRQVFTLYSSQIIALFLGVFMGIINTRALGPKGYGILAFFLSITSFTLLFFRFGFFNAGGLLVAQVKDERKERELIGALIIIAFFVGMTYSLFILLLSFFVDDVFHTNVGWILRYLSFMLIPLPFTFLIYHLGRGTNRVELLSLFNIAPKVIYILGALMLLKVIKVEPFHFIVIYLLSVSISIFIVCFLFCPSFNNIQENLREILKKTKEYGFHVYLGQIADQSTYQLDRIFISYFVNTTQVGFYSLAMTMISPMVGFSKALSVSMFKEFVNVEQIPRKIFYYNFLWLISYAMGLFLFGKFIVTLFFTDKFLPTAHLLLPLALAGFFQGMYQPYGMFFESKGKGKWIRNNSYITSLINLIGNIILIPTFGAYGAAIASALSKMTHYIIYVYYMRRYLKEKTINKIT